MALHFPLMINGHTIGHFTAVRKSGGMDPDDINTYEVEVQEYSPGYDRMLPGWQFPVKKIEVQHRYGDGAWALVRKAMEASQ